MRAHVRGHQARSAYQHLCGAGQTARPRPAAQAPAARRRAPRGSQGHSTTPCRAAARLLRQCCARRGKAAGPGAAGGAGHGAPSRCSSNGRRPRRCSSACAAGAAVHVHAAPLTSMPWFWPERHSTANPLPLFRCVLARQLTHKSALFGFANTFPVYKVRTQT